MVSGSDSETDDGDSAVAAGPKLLGIDPTTNLNVTLRKGPYGFYVQLGEELEKEKGKKAPPKPKRASVPRHMDPASLDLDAALGLLSFPREVCPEPETGRMITAGIGRFGPYIKHGSIYVSLKEDDASFFRIDVAKGKAWGCVAMGESSRGLGEKAKNNPAFVNGLTVTSKGRILPNPGAVLIKAILIFFLFLS